MRRSVEQFRPELARQEREQHEANTPSHRGLFTPENTWLRSLDALDMSAAELARRLKVPANRVTAILKGRRAISGDTALRLADFFGTSPQFWLNLQSLYELRLADEKSGKAIKKLPSLKRVEEVHA